MNLRDSLAQVQELLGCPWCGKVPNIGPWGAQDVNAWPDATAIECSSDLHDCPINPSVTGYTRAEAITAWNTRHGAGDADRSAELTTAWMAGAERERERNAEAWRSIESAPKDGRAVLLAHIGGKPYIGKWCHDTWMDERGLSRGPSHWRPLPAPPTDEAARAGERG